VFERRSALVERIAAGGRDGATGQRGLRISEIRGWHLAQVAVFNASQSEFTESLPRLLGDLPSAVGIRVMRARAKILRTAFDQYWVIATDAQFMSDLALAVPPAAGAVTALSHSRVRLGIEGHRARELLAKGIAIDFHPTVFNVGHFAQTGLHHTSVVVERSGESRYELYALRTFAESIWDWLIDAALPFGYDVDIDQATAA
jgi:methylglutamate dehydrogenase subunit D